MILMNLLASLAALAEMGQSIVTSLLLFPKLRKFGTNVASLLKKHCLLSSKVLHERMKCDSSSIIWSEQNLQTLSFTGVGTGRLYLPVSIWSWWELTQSLVSQARWFLFLTKSK